MTRRARRVAAASLAAGGTLALFFVSRGRWCDPIIDSGREWMLADSLARGDLLYRDVHYWAGPITIYVQAAFFRLFGSSLGALAVAGTMISIATLTALACALRRVTGRDEALLVTALAIPVVVFMPHGGGVLVGMSYRSAAAFALLAIATLSHRRISTGRAAAAGALVGLSGLCRTEFGIAAAAGVLVALAASRRGGDFFRRAVILLSTAAVVFGLVAGGFIAFAGRRAVIEDGHLLLTHIPDATRAFAVSFSAIGDRRLGALHLSYSALLWTGLFLVVRLIASRAAGPVVPRARTVLAVLVLLAAAAALGGATGPILFSAAPAVCLAAVIGGLLLVHRRGAALAGFATTGLLLFHRRPLDIGDSWYIGAPLLFALLAGAGLLRLSLIRERRRADRGRLATSFRWTVAGILALAFAGRLAQYAADDTVAVPGTDGWIHALPATAEGIAGLASAARIRTPSTGTLVVFPEGEIVNYLAARRNPIRFKLCLPDTVTLEREPEIVAELERARPDAVVVMERHSPEYGKWAFGRDYGSSIATWIAKRYAEVSSSAPGRHPFGGVGRIFLKRSDVAKTAGRPIKAVAIIGRP